MSNKVYPNSADVRRQNKSVSEAMETLTSFNIQILSVEFRRTNPKIKVAHCPGTERIKSALMGSGFNTETGKSYLIIKSYLSGCEVFWQEVKNA